MNKSILLAAISAFVFTTSFTLAGEGACDGCAGMNPPARQKVAGEKQQYTCEMHPEVISDKPGKCPKCGMNLVPKKDEGKKS